MFLFQCFSLCARCAVTKDEEAYCVVEVQLHSNANGPEPLPLRFHLDERDAEEFLIALRGYHRLYTGQWFANGVERKELQISEDSGESWWADNGT